jgi:hypothetical protein
VRTVHITLHRSTTSSHSPLPLTKTINLTYSLNNPPFPIQVITGPSLPTSPSYHLSDRPRRETAVRVTTTSRHRIQPSLRHRDEALIKLIIAPHLSSSLRLFDSTTLNPHRPHNTFTSRKTAICLQEGKRRQSPARPPTVNLPLRLLRQ